MHENQKPIEIRIKHSLQRVGYHEIHVVHLGNGHVKLTGTVPSAQDRAIVNAVARTVTGIKQVSMDVGESD